MLGSWIFLSCYTSSLFSSLFFFSLENDYIIDELIDELEGEMVDELTSLFELSMTNSTLSCLKNVIFVFLLCGQDVHCNYQVFL